MEQRDVNFVAVQMELTNNCLCACAECPRELSQTRAVGNMDLDLAKLIVDDALAYNPNCGFNLNGLGEPLLYKHLPELLRYMEGKGAVHADLFTSLKCPDKLIDPLIEVLQDLQMNIMCAVTKHVYDVNGDSNLDLQQFERNFQKVMALPDAHPETRIGVEKNIGMIATRYHSKQELDEFRAYYEQFLPSGSVHTILSLNPWFNTVADMAHPDFGPTPPALEPTVCDYPFILLHTAWNGDCLICCSDDIAGEMVMGKIEKPGDLRAVWEGALYQEIRRKHNCGDVNGIPACNKCERTAFARIDPLPEGALVG